MNNEVTNKILQIFHDHGQENYIGEEITQLEHACQSAYFAQKDGASKELVLACLLHDIGHLLPETHMYLNGEDLGVKDHETVGANFLRKLGLPEAVCIPAENHVKSKRYMLSKDAKLHDQLSEASQKTFILQGGKMTQQEMLEYETSQYFAESIKLREYENMAKVKNLKTLSFEHYLASN